jgi:hypothetical protein
MQALAGSQDPKLMESSVVVLGKSNPNFQQEVLKLLNALGYYWPGWLSPEQLQGSPYLQSM